MDRHGVPNAMTLWFRHAALSLAAATALAGGGGGNPIGNPPTVVNPPGLSGQKLSFAYFQRCINPIFQTSLQINQGGLISTNTCAGSGCHDDANGTGGAFRVLPSAQLVDLANPANTADVIRLTEMYRNYYSAQGEVVIGAPMQSRLMAKPLLLGVLHGGGLIFPSDTDPNAQLIRYWITHPMPAGHDEFSSAAAGLFTPADIATGACNTQ
jgi:hypothetical protein